MGLSIRKRRWMMGKQFDMKKIVILEKKMAQRVERIPTLLMLMIMNHCCVELQQ